MLLHKLEIKVEKIFKMVIKYLCWDNSKISDVIVPNLEHVTWRFLCKFNWSPKAHLRPKFNF